MARETLLLELVEGADDAGRVSGDDGVGRHVLGDDAARADDGVRTDNDVGQQGDVDADLGIVADIDRAKRRERFVFVLQRPGKVMADEGDVIRHADVVADANKPRFRTEVQRVDAAVLADAHAHLTQRRDDGLLRSVAKF